MPPIRHGLQVAGNTAVGLGVLLHAEAAGDLLLDLGHSQVTLGAVVGEGHVGISGKQQDGGLMLFQSLPEIVGIGLGELAPFAARPGRDWRQLLFTSREDISVALLQIGQFLIGQAFFIAMQVKYIDFIDIYADLDENERNSYEREYPEEAEIMSGFAERFIQQGVQQGKHEGRQEGRQEGEAAMLLRLLQLKFGAVPEALRRKVESADPQTRLEWSDRVLTASSIEQVISEKG